MALKPIIAGGFYTSGGGGSPGGSSGQLQFNNASAFGGISGWSSNGTTTITGGAGSILSLDTGSAAAPSLTFGSSGTGLYTGLAANHVGVTVSGVLYFDIAADSFSLKSTSAFNWSSSTLGNTPDLNLRRHAASVLGIDSDSSGTPPILLDGSTGAINAGTGTFQADATANFYEGTGAGLRVRVQAGGGSPDGIYLSSGLALAWTNDSNNAAGAKDLLLLRDAANTLAQRNGTNAQTFNLYGTYTDGSNYDRVRISRSFFGHEALGTGSVQNFTIKSSNELYFGSAAGSTVWGININGHLLALTDNTYDIGASGATRPRQIYAGTAITAPAIYFNAAQDVFGQAQASGVLLLSNGAGTDFSRLQFGGTTSSFPALKRASTGLECRLADDSGYAPFTADQFIAGALGGVTATFTTITSITVTGGIITAITGS